MRQHMQLLRRGGRMGLITSLAIVGSAVAVAGDDAPSHKLAKQIRMFEQTANQMLVDSTNFLVANNNASGGLYLPGYGVVFTFNASILDREFNFDWGDWDEWMDNIKIERKDGQVIVHLKDIDEDEAEEIRQEAEEALEEARERVREAREEAREAREEAREALEEAAEELEDLRRRGFPRKAHVNWEEKHAELYERGKEEIVDLLVDYGETLGRLADTDRVMIAAFLNKSDFLRDRNITKLVVSAQMSDIRNFAHGNINEADFRNLISILEY